MRGRAVVLAIVIPPATTRGRGLTFFRIRASLYRRQLLAGDTFMSDMRLVVAGAGGRMGRTLIHAIAATDGVILAGAVEAASSAVIGRDAGELAGLGKNGVAVTTDIEPLLAQADGLLDFTVPAATLAFAERTARKRCVHIRGTTGTTGENAKLIEQASKRAVIVKSGNMSMGVNLLAALVKQVAKTLDEDFDIEI